MINLKSESEYMSLCSVINLNGRGGDNGPKFAMGGGAYAGSPHPPCAPLPYLRLKEIYEGV